MLVVGNAAKKSRRWAPAAGHQLPVALVRFQVGSKFKAANGLDRNTKPAKIGKRRKPPKENIQRHTSTETPAFDEAQYARSVGGLVCSLSGVREPVTDSVLWHRAPWGIVQMNSVVKTRSGELCGSFSNGVHSFKVVPYAAPPFGNRRFLPPQPVEAWSGVRDALAFGPKPPQLPYFPPWDLLIPEHPVSGEDCLNLNIWSAGLGSAAQPVMVWIPGGAFEHGTGAAPMYDGSRFARDGVVCVTINYRLGADGFLYLGPGIANHGLLDQLAALMWVQENIAAFGGDPDNVTVFGESAGAMCISTLLSMPRAKGLFRRAIAQSGGPHQVIPAATAERVGGSLAKKLGVAATREAIAAVSTDRLLQAQAALMADLIADPDPSRWGHEVAVSMVPWQPVIDGDVIPARPIDRIVGGAGADIDLMVGATSDEWRFFLVPSGAIQHISAEALAGVVAAYGLPVEKALDAYRAADPAAGAGDLLAAVQGDWYVRIPVMRLADAHAKGASTTFVYEFAWPSRQFNGLLGACHGLEIGFVFDTLGCGTEPLAGADPPQLLADVMHAAWVGFATRGDPGWPRYELTRRTTMRFDSTSQVVSDPLAWKRAIWDGAR
jgi:carboxylesterase type B